jgi:hypothetical protein
VTIGDVSRHLHVEKVLPALAGHRA